MGHCWLMGAFDELRVQAELEIRVQGSVSCFG